MKKEKEKESAVGLFFSMFLRAAVIVLGLIIILFGLVFLLKISKRNTDKGPETTVGDNVLTEAEAHDELLYNGENGTQGTVSDSHNLKILVLNSTQTAGLAGRWRDELNSKGYANVDVSDYSNAQTNSKIFVKQEGTGQDLIPFFNGATYEIGTITEGTSADPGSYDIIIIIGSNDDTL